MTETIEQNGIASESIIELSDIEESDASVETGATEVKDQSQQAVHPSTRPLTISDLKEIAALAKKYHREKPIRINDTFHADFEKSIFFEADNSTLTKDREIFRSCIFKFVRGSNQVGELLMLSFAVRFPDQTIEQILRVASLACCGNFLTDRSYLISQAAFLARMFEDPRVRDLIYFKYRNDYGKYRTDNE